MASVQRFDWALSFDKVTGTISSWYLQGDPPCRARAAARLLARRHQQRRGAWKRCSVSAARAAAPTSTRDRGVPRAARGPAARPKWSGWTTQQRSVTFTPTCRLSAAKCDDDLHDLRERRRDRGDKLPARRGEGPHDAALRHGAGARRRPGEHRLVRPRSEGDLHRSPVRARRTSTAAQSTKSGWITSRPQENGNKTDVRWVALTNAQGVGLLAVGAPTLSVAARHYTKDDMERAGYTFQMQRHPEVYPESRLESRWASAASTAGVPTRGRSRLIALTAPRRSRSVPAQPNRRGVRREDPGGVLEIVAPAPPGTSEYPDVRLSSGTDCSGARSRERPWLTWGAAGPKGHGTRASD